MSIAVPSALKNGVANILDRATHIYAQQGLKFTILRKHVVEVLAEKDTPIGAYEIRRILADRYRQLSPITVYRTLGSLIDVGLVRKLASRNAFFLASDAFEPWNKDRGQRISLICTTCKRVCEATSSRAYDALETASASVSFSLSVSSVEVIGVCDRCSARRVSPTRSAKVANSRDRK